MNYTPGPWFHTKHAQPNEVARVGRAWNISTMLALSEFGDAEADARLISSAPDLLEALQAAYSTFSNVRLQWDGRHTLKGQKLLCSMRDAIAKATGKKEQEVQDGEQPCA